MVSPRIPHASEQHADRAPGQLPLEQGEPPNFSGHKTNCPVQNNEHCSDSSTRELHTLNNNTTHPSNKLLSIPTNCNLPDNTATSYNNLDSPNSFLSAAGSLTSSPSALPNPSTQQPPPFATSPSKHQASAQKKPPPLQQPPVKPAIVNPYTSSKSKPFTPRNAKPSPNSASNPPTSLCPRPTTLVPPSRAVDWLKVSPAQSRAGAVGIVGSDV